MKKTITVLLSTYNGEKYLRGQLESLISQDYLYFNILVRDDGSKDKTTKILEEYCLKTNGLLSYYIGNNVGPCKSFLQLLVDAPPSDYYAFCDQDDIWDKDKLSCAIAKIEKFDATKPNLYFSNLRIVDENLNFIRESHTEKLFRYNKYSPLIESLPSGCTMLFNKRVKSFICSCVPFECSMHDTWVYLICSFFGNVVYDEISHLSYRIHNKNAVGTYKSKTFFSYINTIANTLNNNKNQTQMDATNFLKCYKDLLDDDICEKLKKISNYNNSFHNMLSLLLDNELRASTTIRQIKYKLLVILQRL